MSKCIFFIDNSTSLDNGSTIRLSLTTLITKHTVSLVEMNFTNCFANIKTGVNDQFTMVVLLILQLFQAVYILLLIYKILLTY